MRGRDLQRMVLGLGSAVRMSGLVLGAVLLAGTGSGCAHTTAPPEWLPKADEAGEFPYGGWVTVDWREGKSKHQTDGELVAVTDSSVVVLEEGKNPRMGHAGLTEIAKEDIKTVKVMSYRANLGPVVGWSTVGAISTISHGWGLILSFPVWLLVGTAVTISASNDPQTAFPKGSWNDLRKYARFPQGVPENGVW